MLLLAPSGGGLRIARSLDSGQSWSYSDLTSTQDAAVTHAGGGNWVLVAASGPQLYGYRSTDNGQTWSGPLVVAASGLGFSTPSLAGDDDGNILAAWVGCGSLNCTQTETVVATSSNAGLSWTAPVTVATHVGPYCGCMTASIATDEDGTWMIAWNDYAPANFVSNSVNNGVSWSTPVEIPQSYGALDLTTNRDGGWVVDDGVKYTRSADDGATWSPYVDPEHSFTLSSGGGVWDVGVTPPLGYYACDIAADADCDGYLDGVDECPYVAGDSQLDPDSDGLAGPCDNCPAWYNPAQNLPPWPHAVPDADCDRFLDAEEAAIGTLSNQQCAATSAANDEDPPDAWPTDFNDNRTTNVIDVGFLVPVLGSSSPGPPYNVRFDLNANGIINTIDVGRFVPLLNKSCS